MLLKETMERMWPDAVAGDEACSTIAMRTWLTTHEIESVIPYRSNESGPKTYDQDAYQERPIIERTVNQLKRYRRIATHFEKLANAYLAMVMNACILEWL